MDTQSEPNVLRFRQAIQIFHERNASGQIFSRKTGEVLIRKPRRLEQTISAVRTTLVGVPGVEVPEEVDLVPLRNTLPGIAARLFDAKKASEVALFLQVTLATDSKRSPTARPDTSLDQVLPAWQPLFAVYVCASSGKAIGNPSYRANMMTFIDTMVTEGIMAPDNLPPDRDSILAIMDRAGVPEEKQRGLLTAYRHAVELLDSPLPRYMPRRPFERGLRSLPNLRKLCEDGITRRLKQEPTWKPPSMTRFESWHVREILQCVAPEASIDLEEYLVWAEVNGGRSEGHNDRAMDAVASLVAELLRLGLYEEVWHANLLQMFLAFRLDRGLQAATAAMQRRMGSIGAQSRSLARIAIDEAALKSLDNSVLDVHTTLTNAKVPYYTSAIRNQFFALVGVVEYVHGVVADAQVQNPVGWDIYQREFKALVDAIEMVNKTATTDGHKNIRLLPITWAQLEFVGLPKLRKKVKAAQVAYWSTLERAEGNTARSAVRKAFSRYSHAIRLYILAALFLADGMRGRNYGYGRWNVNFIPTWELRDGAPYRITAIRVFFGGQDAIARPKKSRTVQPDGTNRFHTRDRQLNAALVDLDIVSDYVLEVRPRDLVRAGAIADLDSYDVLSDEHAFLVNPARPRKSASRPTRARAANRSDASFSLGHFSKVFGFWMLAVARELLKPQDDPEGEPLDTEGKPLPTKTLLKSKTPEGRAARKRWRGIFNGHVSRHLVTSYIGGWCELWPIAMALTDDTRETLERVYNHDYAQFFESLRFKVGIHHPDHFKALTIALFKEPVLLDWDEFDPENPMDALRWVGAGSDRSQAV